MAITDSKKLDFLWKKIAFGKTETNIDGKFGFNETTSSPVATYSKDIWAESESVPSSAPNSTTGVVSYVTYQCTSDPTVSGDKTWLATPTFGTASSLLGDWVDPTFAAGYLLSVYDGDPSSGGVALNQGVDGSEWVFDYIAGVLHFPNAVQGGATEIWIRGHRYVGTKGLPSGGSSSPFTEFYADNTARDADTVQKGTLAIVTDAGDGEGATYVANVAGPTSNWTLISSDDSANLDSKTLTYTITPSDDGVTVSMGNASSGSRVIDVAVEVDTAFDGAPTMTVGTTATPSALVADTDFDLSEISNYQITPSYRFSSTVDEVIKIFFTGGAAAVGSVVVTVTFV